MATTDYVKKLEPMENAFEMYISSRLPVGKLEEILSATLSNTEFHGKTKHYTVIMAKRTFNTSEPAFGINIFPAINKMQELAEKMVNEDKPWKTVVDFWHTIDEWTIEMDPRLFDRNTYGLNHKEAVACILHEVGHTVYSDRIVERLLRSYKAVKLSMKIPQKAATKAGYFIFMVPLMVACAGPNLVRNLTRGQNEEKWADSLAKKCGYGDHLVTAMDKLMKEYGRIAATDAQLDKEVDVSSEWAGRMISDMAARRNHLANDLFSNGVKSASGFIKTTNAYILNLMGAGLRENYTGDAVEGEMCGFDPVWGAAVKRRTAITTVMYQADALEHYSVDLMTDEYNAFEANLNFAIKNAEAAMEGLFHKKIKEGLPSWRDIDQYQIEIDRIRNTTDRQLMLDKIYGEIEDIQDFMESIVKNKREFQRYKPEADRMLKVLDNYREQVLGKHTGDDPTADIKTPTDYGFMPPKPKGLFYAPKGYQG